ncbi:GNAT family N-acetyltransferase [Elizabethkingia argentiflava]|uniref:GNAT family N-acetyltransferase n=1 Tax=Elizabethkingia argenteiflava TaxID=2681556 RepID=A0A845PRV1_9FLAO|nr:GNAT family N-acetyltransferase [Elizabethkingia argenteiflava]NAW50932.1 GNAT family N-acetyltransferase [Elizabethkingia argenteiflava]
MENKEIKIRQAVEADSEKIWALMQELAIFEKYIDVFAITPAIVAESGFHKNPPDFRCIVAEDHERIVGIMVYYFIPYTLHNRPDIYMKELYVAEAYRGKKIGERLMNQLKKEALSHHCGQINWKVAPWNEAGKKFYKRLGATENTEWLNYEWDIQK